MEESKSKTTEATKSVIEKTKELTKDGVDNVNDKTKLIRNVSYNIFIIGINSRICIRKAKQLVLFI